MGPQIVGRGACVAVLTMLAVGGLSSCGDAQDGAVTREADSYAKALASGDAAAACSTLATTTRSELEESSGKSCAKSILDEAKTDLGALVDVRAYGTMAQARFAGDTVFLSRYPTGWRVLAAACKPPDKPGLYDCKVQGG
jgi:hypothetical protein